MAKQEDPEGKALVWAASARPETRDTHIFHFLGWITQAAIGGWGSGLCALWLFLCLVFFLGQASLPWEGHLAHPKGLALVLLDELFHSFQLILHKSAASRGVLIIDWELVHELASAVEGTLSTCHRLLLLGDELHVLQAQFLGDSWGSPLIGDSVKGGVFASGNGVGHDHAVSLIDANAVSTFHPGSKSGILGVHQQAPNFPIILQVRA